jgi:pyrimidine-nucleoside phosphorylase
MHIPTLIARKRDGGELTPDDIRKLIDGYTTGTVPDYQMAAFAMAVFFSGMTPVETAALTRAMMESGDRFHHPPGPPVVDKHSTGGIGDKISLVLAPLAACAGCRIPMVSGRGLGITGGTLDKLESIPGFRVRLQLDEAAKQLDQLGVVMMGQTERFCPADKKLYSLRDVTGTVPSIPLITASIMSKKLAESPERLVLDVKYGTGAFMRTEDEARRLAESMQAVGKEMNVEVHAMLNPMSEPTGRAVGNALEVIEAIECLGGGGPADLRNLTLQLTATITGMTTERLAAMLDDGTARRKFDAIVAAQGGDPTDLNRLAEIQRAPVIRDLPSPASGTVTRADAGIIGQTALQLGAGRALASDAVDPAVGIDRLIKTGERARAGEPLCRIHARSDADADMAASMLLNAFEIRTN